MLSRFFPSESALSKVERDHN
jgi:hypothetical protein